MNLKTTGPFLEGIDATWQGRGFNSRSEFIHYVLRDAVEFTTFDRDELIALLAAEEDIYEGQRLDAEEVRERFGTADVTTGGHGSRLTMGQRRPPRTAGGTR